MTLEEAVALPGRKVQVLGKKERNGEYAILIHTITNEGAKQVAWHYLPPAERTALSASLEARGVPVAESDFHTNILWLRTADGIEVYDNETKLLDAAGDRATLADGTVVARADIARVCATASANYVHRGVTAVLKSGQEVELVMEISMSAMGDPTYSRNELLFETSGWLPSLASALAAWAGVGFEDKV